MENTIRVEGKGYVKREPDVIALNFKLKYEHKDYQKALEEYNKGYGTLLEAVSKSGLSRDEVKTSNLHIGTQYEQEHDGRVYRNVFKGYLITSDLFLELPMDLSLLSKVIDEIAGRGTTPEFTITFGIRDEENELSEALKEAALDARKKAALLAETLGLSLGHVRTVIASRDDHVKFHSRVEMPREMKAMDMQITPRDVEVESRVEIIFEIL